VLRRERILPENHLPAADVLIAAGRGLADRVRLAGCPFLDVLARTAHTAGADFIAISSYNGIALGFVDDLNRTLAALGLRVPVYIGGKLNQVPESSNTSLPVDIRAQLRRAGALPCDTVSEMLSHLAALAREKSGAGTV